jgi:hypothetical protein
MAYGLFPRGPLLMKERHFAGFADGAISVCANFFRVVARSSANAADPVNVANVEAKVSNECRRLTS